MTGSGSISSGSGSISFSSIVSLSLKFDPLLRPHWPLIDDINSKLARQRIFNLRIFFKVRERFDRDVKRRFFFTDSSKARSTIHEYSLHFDFLVSECTIQLSDKLSVSFASSSRFRYRRTVLSPIIDGHDWSGGFGLGKFPR